MRDVGDSSTQAFGETRKTYNDMKHIHCCIVSITSDSEVEVEGLITIVCGLYITTIRRKRSDFSTDDSAPILWIKAISACF